MGRFDRVLTIVLVLCAVISTGIVTYRQFFAIASTPGQIAKLRGDYVRDWTAHMKGGPRVGSANAPIQLLEFSDFECPYCADLHSTLKSLRRTYPNTISIIYVEFPIPGHRNAVPAARAAECADQQDRYEAMHDLLFEQQNQIGIKSWSEFAAQSGIPSMAQFQSCIDSNSPSNRIETGRKLGDQMDVRGTPTLLINGWKLNRPPSHAELNEIIKRVLSGHDPV